MAYQGFFVRDTLGQTPSGGSAGPWSVSPDVILAGTTPGDPAQYVSAAGYNIDFGGNAYTGEANYVYLRALNASSGASTGRAWLFYTEADLCLWPDKWQSAGIQVAGATVNHQPISAGAAGQVCVTEIPFLWTPPQPAQSTHYCNVAWIENAPLSAPPVSPVASLPPFRSFDQLANFVLEHHNMGWRNVVNIAGAKPTWQSTTRITGPAEPAKFYIGIQWHNMPTDGYYAFSVPGPDGTNNIAWPEPPNSRAPIPVPTSSMTVPVTWPANFTSSITISYWQGATAPPPGASISPTIIIPPSALSAATLAKARHLAPHRLLTDFDATAGRSAREQGPGFVLGSVAHRF